MVFTGRFGDMGCHAARSQNWGRGCSRQGAMGSSQHCSKQVWVLTAVTLGPLDFVPNLFLPVVEPCTSYTATITQMESFFTEELSGGIFHFGNVWGFSNVQSVGRPVKGYVATAWLCLGSVCEVYWVRRSQCLWWRKGFGSQSLWD